MKGINWLGGSAENFWIVKWNCLSHDGAEIISKLTITEQLALNEELILKKCSEVKIKNF